MRKIKFSQFLGLFALIALIHSCGSPSGQSPERTYSSFRAPAYPLITIDPYTSAWSMTDLLFDSPVRHWTGKTHSLIGAIRVDGEVYRFLGKEDLPLRMVLPMAKDEVWTGKYLLEQPKGKWEQAGYDDSKWISGQAAFGTPGMENISTAWTTKEIWTRREFELPGLTDGGKIYLIYSHDDDFELYLNGQQIVNTGYKARTQVMLELDQAMLNPVGSNVIATHCIDRGGLAYVDYGLYVENTADVQFNATAEQTGLSMSATSTRYTFTCGPVDLDLVFQSPLIPDDPELLSRPVSYITYKVGSNDGAKHQVQLYFETTPQWAVNDVSQEVLVKKGECGGVEYISAGTTEQPILEKRGDNLRIDWGYVYLAGEKGEGMEMMLGDYVGTKRSFIESGKLSSGPEELVARMSQSMPAMALVKDLGEVGSSEKSSYLMLAYDDVESIQYFGDNLKAVWRKGGELTIDDALALAVAEYKQVTKRCAAFDNELWDEAVEVGGKNYADLCVLAFRQSVAAHKLVMDTEGNMLFLSKENFSNGSIGTVDVTYPSAPLYLKYNPDLLKGMLIPIFYFTESGKWTKPFAAHDVGTYPQANGQTYGGDMPVEECGNMIILTAAIAKAEGSAAFAEEHWEALTTWANYLLENGLDPENQLCTDDFAGHFAHNVNLSVKAIMGIASYGQMAATLGKTEEAEKYNKAAAEMAGKWVEMAADGDHYRLTFDQPGTWSMKYNLVWDKLLGFSLFPREVAQTEIAYYLTKQNNYGLPLDNRRSYTKSDWIVWTATLADDKETFERFIDPLHLFIAETPDRVPMTDWYETETGKQVGFQARSVVGGYFIKMLEE